MKGNRKEPIEFLVKLKDLELHTDAGRINYRWGILLVILIVVLTANDGLLIAFAYIISTIKTCILKTNILELPESANVWILIILTLVFFVFCMVTLCVYERSKEKTKEKLKKFE